MVDILDAANINNQPGTPPVADPSAPPVPPMPPEPVEPPPPPPTDLTQAPFSDMPVPPAPPSDNGDTLAVQSESLIVPPMSEPVKTVSPTPQAPIGPPKTPVASDKPKGESILNRILKTPVKKTVSIPTVLPNKPRKKMGRKSIIIAFILLLMIGGIGAGVYLVGQHQDLFSWAVWHPPRANVNAPYTGPGSTSNPGTGGTGSTTETTSTGTQPAGTYAVYANGASSGQVVGYRYIQAAGVFDGAIQRAAGGNTADASLLASQYGLSGADLTTAAQHIASGQTWAPPGVGGVTTWHWTTCADTGTGVSGVGCDVTKTSTNNSTSTPVDTPTPTPTPAVIPTDTPTPTPTPGPNDTPTPTPTPGPNPTSTPTPTPTPVQHVVSCNSSCTVNADCVSGLVCVSGFCRNASCVTDSSCVCAVAQVPIPPTPKTPVSGGPTVLGASVIGIGTLILILGLAL